jgi:hypothetical protein
VQGVVQPVLANLALECACADTQHSGRLVTTSVEELERSTRLRDWSNLYSKGAHVIRSTHRARHAPMDGPIACGFNGHSHGPVRLAAIPGRGRAASV